MKTGKLFVFLSILSLILFGNAADCPWITKNCDADVSFTIEPPSGTVNTMFKFSAESHFIDCDDEGAEYQWCYYLEGEDCKDGYRSDWSYKNISYFKYDQPGTYSIQCYVLNDDNLGGYAIAALVVSAASGSDPTASFSFSPLTGTTATLFSFDASKSSDIETSADQLKVRWDWNGDGTWDTDPTTTKEAQHQFAVVKTYDVTLLVIDEHDATDQLTKQISVGSEPGDPCPGLPEVVYNGEAYPTVQIGEQCWLRKNLNVGEFLEANTTAQTDNNKIEKYCYDDDESNCEIYGGLYLWEEMMEYETTEGARGICPPDWHIPSRQDWNDLDFFLGSDNPGGNLKALTHWKSPNTGATNESGFSALPGGWCDGYGSGDYTFVFLTEIASFHGSYISGAHYGGKELFYNGGDFPWHEDTPIKSARSVRCIYKKQ